MTGMLASVTSVNEADIVLRAGVDIIDIKDPAQGALGALNKQSAQDIVNHIAGQVMTSATIGDLPSEPELISTAITKTASTGVDIVKVGLFERVIDQSLLDVFREKSEQGIEIVVVLFAENHPDFDLLEDLAATGIKGVMLDTAMKGNGTLRTILNDNVLKYFVDQAQSADLMTGLAGSLVLGDIEPLLLLDPDYLGFRGALCREHQRIEEIDEMSVHRIRSRIPKIRSKATRLSAIY
jgi:uncharacterized protein (UPF0264 family)